MKRTFFLRKSSVYLCGVLLLTAFPVTPGSFPEAAERLFDSIAIETGNKAVTVNEIKQALTTQAEVIKQQNQPAPDMAQLTAQIINSMIDDMLLEREAERLNIQVSQEELDDEVKRYKARVGKAENDPLEDILKHLNTTPADFKKKVYKSVMKNKLIGSEVYAKIDVSDEYLRKVHSGESGENYTYTIRHILRRIPSAATAEQKEKSKQEIIYIRQQFEANPENWDTLALTYSDDPSVRTNKGMLTPFRKEQILKEISDPVRQMQVNGVITVESPLGFHLIQLMEKKDTGTADFEAAKEELLNTEQDKQYRKYYRELLNSLRSKYPIKVNAPEYLPYVNYQLPAEG
ncbi:hypothetical protein CHS0354_018481 [Potamilus streckersoni]|uniref:PpiC domain-containing protein n=1 Tax=Potamilus streckersoni TaxID=2493646 RepID=A0AAE0WAX8_9BIVA|nr:hypothetical protein CHS0354_018481 [Potamilus streckersoni]